MPQVLAAADIGSNTVHMLVAEIEGGQLARIDDENDWISLGEVVGRLKQVPPELADRLIATLASFKRTAASLGATSLYVFGTEAIRRASNQEEILNAIRVATGLRVEIITGQREAEFGLRGAWLDTAGEGPFTLCEVGGGSAQVAHCVLGKGGVPEIDREASLPLGTGTLIAELQIDGRCDDAQYTGLVAKVEELLRNIEPDVRRVVACGGVARGIWRALHPDGNRSIAAEELDYLVWAARTYPADVLVDRFQVKPKRAATLLPGAVVYRSVLAHSGLGSMTVSRFGVREGAILEMADGVVEGAPL